jgi:general secretion pathway protein D
LDLSLDGDIATNSIQFVSEKMRNVVIPSVDLEDVGIEEAIDFVRNQAKQLDTTTTDPVQKGFNIVLNIGTSDIGTQVRAMRFNLKVKNVPVSQLLTYICDQTRTQYSIDEFAINIRPLGTDGAELTTRTFKVPPDFLSADAVGNGAAAPAADPFDDAPSEGLSATRMTAEEKLRSMGVSFPEGATATFNGGSSTLLVRNTASNLDFVQQIVDSAAQTEPVQCVVQVTIIKVEETRLEELGFDWVMTPWGIGGNNNGGDSVSLGGGTQGSGDLVIENSEFSPITSGLRSGDTAITKSNIDELISAGTSGFSASNNRAPGVLSLLGKYNDDQIALIMNGLDQKKGVDTMTRPSTVVRSGQTSRIEIIREMIYPTEYEPPELPNTIESTTLFDGLSGQVANIAPPTPITPAMPTAFEKRDIGTTLEVSPIVSNDRRFIELALKPEIVNFDGFVNYGSPITGGYSSGTDFFDVPLGAPFTVNTTIGEITPNEILMPIFSVIRADTSLTIADGSTIVIGGMIQEKVQNVEDQVPILGDLPLVGRLFRTKGLQPVKTNVIIMVRVELQDPSGKPFRGR